MKKSQRTLEESGLPKLLGRMVEDATSKYRGGVERLELVKGHPRLVPGIYELFDQLAAERETMMQPPFMQLEIGNFATIRELRRALDRGGFGVATNADDVLARVMASRATTLPLHKVSNANLGLPNGGTIAQSFEALAAIGGKQLPTEAGPQYRLQRIPNQSVDVWELLYMNPVALSDGRLVVFCVECHDSPYLGIRFVNPNIHYDRNVVWVYTMSQE